MGAVWTGRSGLASKGSWSTGAPDILEVGGESFEKTDRKHWEGSVVTLGKLASSFPEQRLTSTKVGRPHPGFCVRVAPVRAAL